MAAVTVYIGTDIECVKEDLVRIILVSCGKLGLEPLRLCTRIERCCHLREGLLRNKSELYVGRFFLYVMEYFQHGGAVVVQRLVQRGKPMYFDDDISKSIEAAIKAIPQGIPILTVAFR